jgi:ATP-binding cassette subfamily B protein
MTDWFKVLRHLIAVTHRADRKATVLVTVLTVALAAVVTVTSVNQRWLVDSAVSGSVSGIMAAISLGAAAFIMSAAGSRVQSNALLYLTGRTSIAMSREIVHLIGSVPTLAHIERPAHLDRLNRLRWDVSGLAWLPWIVLTAASTGLSVVVSIALLVSVYPMLSLLVLLSFAPLLAGRRAHRMVLDAQDKVTELDRQERRLHELCTRPEPAKELYITGGGNELSRRADWLAATAIRTETRARLRAAALQTAGWLIYGAGYVAALLVIYGLVHQHRATLGDAVLTISLATSLQGQVQRAMEQIGRVSAGGHLVRHYAWLKSCASEPEPGAVPPEQLAEGIVVDRVSFRFPGADRDALSDVTVRLGTGNVIALVGDNGAGKTTLVKILTGLYEPTGGRVSVDGRHLATADLPAWQVRLSAVFQDFARFPLLVREAIGLGDVHRLHEKGAVEGAARRARADRIVARLPHGMDTRLGRNAGGVELSPGQWQLLALARSHMRIRPLLTVLDEPTAALDARAEYELFQQFVRGARAMRARGGITVLVSHRMSTVRMADLIIVLADGQVAEVGTHDELMAAGGAYAEMYCLQQRGYA